MMDTMKKPPRMQREVPETMEQFARLTLTDGSATFTRAGAKSPTRDRQALNQSKRRESAIVIESGAFLVPAPFNDGVDVDAFEHAGFPFCAGSWRTTFTPSPLDRQASGDGFLKQKEATMPRLVLRSRLPFREARE